MSRKYYQNKTGTVAVRARPARNKTKASSPHKPATEKAYKKYQRAFSAAYQDKGSENTTLRDLINTVAKEVKMNPKKGDAYDERTE